MSIELVENIMEWAGGLLAYSALGLVLYGVWRGDQRRAGRTTGRTGGLPAWGKKLRQKPPKSRGEVFRRVTLPIGLDAIFSLAALIGMPAAQGYAVWRALFVWQPDAVYWCLAVGVILAVKAIGRVFLLKRGEKSL